MIVEQQREIISNERRRAKRNKSWLADGNIIPLSTKEKKAIENNEYRIRIKAEKAAKENKTDFNNGYRNHIYDFANQFEYTYKGTLTYKLNVSMFKGYRDGNRIFEHLKKRGAIENYLFVVEYEENHVHTHYMINSNAPKLLSTISSQLNGKYSNGHVYLERLEDADDRNNHLVYLIDKLKPQRRNRQTQIDYWSIDLDIKQLLIDDIQPQHENISMIELSVP